MLRDLTIKNYRCFKDFSIDGLARVNLIVGQNNSGKTSFLEAVYLLVNQDNPSALVELLHRREEYVRNLNEPNGYAYDFSHIFHGPELRIPRMQPMSDHVINLIANHSSKKLEIIPSREMKAGLLEPWNPEIVFHYTPTIVSGASTPLKLSLQEDFTLALDRPFQQQERLQAPYRFLTNSHAVDFLDLSKFWNVLTFTPAKEERIVAALQILEPSVIDIRFGSYATPGSVLVQMQGRSERIPLSSLGDGMRKILAMAILAVMSEDGTLLVDEIDTGLYHGTLTNVWRLLIETAQRLNVQIFATTHSWDCVVAFQEALAQSQNRQGDLGLLFRLQEQGGEIRAIEYDAEDLDIVVRQAIEVR